MEIPMCKNEQSKLLVPVSTWLHCSCEKVRRARKLEGTSKEEGAQTHSQELRVTFYRWRTARRPEIQEREGGEKEKEASELANSPGSAESESCESALRTWLAVPLRGCW
ncbi:uncharacterized protein LJ206_016493 isoform 1-T1 [Theristicus caerulescens]